MQLLRENAESGDAGEQYWLGMSYAYGLNVDEDPERAIIWLRRSVSQGFVPAEHLLGSLYLQSYIENTRKARIQLFAEAAEEGNGYAMYLLGLAYENGWGVKQSLSDALDLYVASTQNDFEEAQEDMDRLKDGVNE